MTDDPEITDPRDPYKRPDIVAEIDRWLVSRASFREATVSHVLLRAARDEIVALREVAARPSPELHALTKERDELREQLGAVRGIAGNERNLSEAIIQQARDEALADCIRICPECANRIKALNTVGARRLRGERP